MYIHNISFIHLKQGCNENEDDEDAKRCFLTHSRPEKGPCPRALAAEAVMAMLLDMGDDGALSRIDDGVIGWDGGGAIHHGVS